MVAPAVGHRVRSESDSRPESELKFISGDSHVVEPPDLWVKRLPARLRDQAPRIEVRDDGDYYVVPGLPTHKETGLLGPMIIAKAKGEPILERTYRYSEQRPGAMDPRERLKDQDLDNIKAEVVYPNWFSLARIPGRELRAACMRVYNEWLAEFCAVAPARFFGAAQLPLLEGDDENVRQTIAEARHAKKLGLRAVMLPHRVQLPYDAPSFDALFAELQDLGLPISIHVSTGILVPFLTREGGRAGKAVLATTCKTSLSQAVIELLWGAVPSRYPRLRFVMTEGGIGWIAFVTNWLDHWWEDHRHHLEPKLDERPSFYFHRSFWATFEDDRPGILTLPMLNEGHLMWGNDYPHTEGTFPASKARVEQDLRDVPEPTRRKLVHDNAAALYGVK